jgi:hypothetical protein
MHRWRERIGSVLAGLALAGLAVLMQARPASVQGPGQPAGFVYALREGLDSDQGTNRIHGFRLDALSGALEPLAGFPLVLNFFGEGGGASERMLYSTGRLYVLSDDILLVFTVDRTSGALTPVSIGPAFTLGPGSWFCMAVHPAGSPVIVGGIPALADPALLTFNTLDFPRVRTLFPTGDATPFSCRLSRDGNFVYAGGNDPGTPSIAGFGVMPGSGVLTPLPGSPFDSGAERPLGYATDGAGRLLTGHPNTEEVRVFTSAAGVLTGVTGNPFPSGGLRGIRHGVLHPAGFYLVANPPGSRLGVYRIAGSGAGTTLTPVSGSPFVSGGQSAGILALTPNGQHLVAANTTSLNLTVFQVDATTGSLASLGTQPNLALGPLGTRITGLAIAPPQLLVDDVPTGSPFFPFVEALFHAGVTTGCVTDPLRYCPAAPVTRGQMAVFLLRAKESAFYTPPACTSPMFGDVPCIHPFAAWINELARRNITAGCGGGNYCPESSVSRQEMAVFLIRAASPGFTPPDCGSPIFGDVSCSSIFAIWIHELVSRNVTSGCGGGNYCPTSPVTREQMAVFLVRAFNLPFP